MSVGPSTPTCGHPSPGVSLWCRPPRSARPLAGGANYAAVKAATEAWARAVAQGFAKDARDAGKPLAAASVVFRVKSLSGLEEALAQRFTDLWTTPADETNDTIVELTDPSL